jgi:outer membrane protein assembly factor BamB
MPSSDDRPVCCTRRRALRLGGVALGGFAAGCAGDSDGGSTGTTTDTATTDRTTDGTQFPPPEPTPESPTDPRPVPVESDWPRTGFDDANRGHDPVTAAPDSAEVYWQFYTQATPPVVADGTLYAVEHARDRALVARDAATGRREWTASFTGGGFGPAVVAGDRIVLQTYSTLWAFDREGSPLWQYDLGRGDPGSPVVRDGVVYGCTGSYRDWPATAFAVGPDDEERWTVELDGDLRGSPAVVGETLYVATETGALRALALADGSERFSADLGSPSRATPTVANGVIFVTDEDDTIHARSADDGSAVWTASVDTSGYGGLATAGERLFVPAREAVVALDVADGSERWRTAVDEPTTPAVGAETVYAGARGFEDRSVYALDPETGDVRWSHRTEEMQVSDQILGGIVGPPTPVAGGVYAVAADGLYALGAP